MTSLESELFEKYCKFNSFSMKEREPENTLYKGRVLVFYVLLQAEYFPSVLLQGRNPLNNK